ncbi:DUF4293 domain-containing protein [Avrilella dinanensis]|uniref:Transcription termination factor Rho n=1 Tax=Avrilella dinanensis TaxID=2008672 RepID=A0A2M9R3T8_9FLAO|nr:DUF4293 domain-containing protein [Avrilella dinanensis]PJR03415.1 transcription termination factor Rho [Avrilella dinanensis]
MIQRIQSVYLLLVFVISGVLSLFIPLWKNMDGVDFYAAQNQWYVILFGLSAALSIFSLLGYKKRQTQFVYNRINILLNFILIGLFVYQTLNLSGETTVSEKGIGMFLPLVSIILLALANKAIKRDENLVKSADRIR